jgi:hypothetical protein
LIHAWAGISRGRGRRWNRSGALGLRRIAGGQQAQRKASLVESPVAGRQRRIADHIPEQAGSYRRAACGQPRHRLVRGDLGRCHEGGPVRIVGMVTAV